MYFETSQYTIGSLNRFDGNHGVLEKPHVVSLMIFLSEPNLHFDQGSYSQTHLMITGVFFQLFPHPIPVV